MNRTLVLLAAAVAAAGCQNPAWQNPYAMIGPSTVPPPASPTSVGSYQPTAAPAAVTAGSATASGGPIRSEITATPRASRTGSIEEPIRIVEAAPSTKTSSNTKTIPPIVVAATPTSRSTSAAPATASPAPAVKFNPSPPATSPPATSRTRGYLQPPAAAPPTTAPPTTVLPKNRLSPAAPATRRDAAVTQATFVETTTAASGQWKAR